jgi:hypothetical protein
MAGPPAGAGTAGASASRGSQPTLWAVQDDELEQVAGPVRTEDEVADRVIADLLYGRVARRVLDVRLVDVVTGTPSRGPPSRKIYYGIFSVDGASSVGLVLCRGRRSRLRVQTWSSSGASTEADRRLAASRWSGPQTGRLN